MTKHRYLLIEISKEFEPIVKNTKAIPSDHEAYCIIDLATATISNDGKDWTPFEIEGEAKPVFECATPWCESEAVAESNGMLFCEKHLKNRLPIETGVGNQLSKTLDVIEKLTHFKPCNNNDNQL